MNQNQNQKHLLATCVRHMKNLFDKQNNNNQKQSTVNI